MRNCHAQKEGNVNRFKFLHMKGRVTTWKNRIFRFNTDQNAQHVLPSFSRGRKFHLRNISLRNTSMQLSLSIVSIGDSFLIQIQPFVILWNYENVIRDKVKSSRVQVVEIFVQRTGINSNGRKCFVVLQIKGHRVTATLLSFESLFPFQSDLPFPVIIKEGYFVLSSPGNLHIILIFVFSSKYM